MNDKIWYRFDALEATGGILTPKLKKKSRQILLSAFGHDGLQMVSATGNFFLQILRRYADQDTSKSHEEDRIHEANIKGLIRLPYPTTTPMKCSSLQTGFRWKIVR
jgi:hypothetical protein